MMIGIMSDSHGNTRRTARAIEAIARHRPVHVIHCGDIGASAVIAELAAGFMEPLVQVTCVLGNVDAWEDTLTSPWPHVRIAGRYAELNLAGKTMAVIHGDDPRRLGAVLQSQKFDYVFTGHTHERNDCMEGRTRIINPGALHRTHEPGCAVLDLATGMLTYFDVA